MVVVMSGEKGWAFFFLSTMEGLECDDYFSFRLRG